MRLILGLAVLSLAACDVPDPSSFPKHALRESLATGSHIAGVGNDLDSSSSNDTHFLERMNTGTQQINGPPMFGGSSGSAK